MSRIIIAGGRDFNDWNYLAQCCRIVVAMRKLAPIILSGKARGADSIGAAWAKEAGFLVEEYPADWDTYGKGAGMIRNQEMADNADVLVAFWDGKSKGTKGMIDIAMKEGLEVHVYRY